MRNKVYVSLGINDLDNIVLINDHRVVIKDNIHYKLDQSTIDSIKNDWFEDERGDIYYSHDEYLLEIL